MSGSGISWAICKSALWPRHITTPASHHSLFLCNGNGTDKLRVRVYPRVGSVRVNIFGVGRVWVWVSIIGYGYESGSWNGRPADHYQKTQSFWHNISVCRTRGRRKSIQSLTHDEDTIKYTKLQSVKRAMPQCCMSDADQLAGLWVRDRWENGLLQYLGQLVTRFVLTGPSYARIWTVPLHQRRYSQMETI